MSAGWVCDACGSTGVVPEGGTVEQVLCDVCGEPVLSAGSSRR